jgi:hypothetical protein
MNRYVNAAVLTGALFQSAFAQGKELVQLKYLCGLS